MNTDVSLLFSANLQVFGELCLTVGRWRGLAAHRPIGQFTDAPKLSTSIVAAWMSMTTSTLRSRFWLLFAAAWLPYAISYYVLFRFMPGSFQPIRQVLYNILPAAAVGSLIVPWSSVFCWKYHRKWWFYPGQIASAMAYSGLWYGGVLLVSSLGTAIATHRFVLGYFSAYALQWQMFSGLMIYGNIAGAMYVAQVNEQLRSEEARRLQAEALKVHAELSALRSHLNPHFLFNTLNSIMALAGPEQPRVMQAIGQLAGMLRYSLRQDTENEGVSLRQELAFTDQYLALEALRLGDRLQILRDISSEALTSLLPPLTLQPLVENAIRHGIAKKSGGGTIVLRAVLRQSSLYIEVEDDGMGSLRDSLLNAQGVGIRTIRQRLELFSNGEATFSVRTAPGLGCRITISLPQELRFHNGAFRKSTETALATNAHR